MLNESFLKTNIPGCLNLMDFLTDTDRFLSGITMLKTRFIRSEPCFRCHLDREIKQSLDFGYIFHYSGNYNLIKNVNH